MTNQLLDDLLSLAGEAPSGGAVTFAGADPVLPVPLRIGEMGAATIGASAIMAARLWQMRGGRAQSVHIDVDSAAAAMRSSRYVALADVEPVRRAGGGPGLPVYRSKDGRWVYFQQLFQHHRDRIAGVLGCEFEPEAIRAAVATWDGQTLEDAVAAAGACPGLIRTYHEWHAHPQGQALAELPLIEITKVGESAPEPLAPSERPLGGVRVLDLTRVLAGPTCARTLAEHGADVLRVGTPRVPDNPAMQQDTGHGKRSCALELNDASDSETLRGLIRGTDVFSQGYRPGSLAGRGFGVEDVVALRPGVVYVSISAFGHEGPWSARRGFDSVVQSVSGMFDECARDGVPRSLPANPLDYATGYLAAFGVMVALRRRAREGGSYHVRVSLAQTGRWLASIPRVEGWQERPPELPQERLQSLTTSSETPFGRLRHLAPCAQMSVTPGRWDRPSVPLDQDLAAW